MKAKQALTRLLAVLLVVLLLTVPVLAIPQGGQEQLDLLKEIAEQLDKYALYPPEDLTLEGITARALEEDPELFMKTVNSWLEGDKYGVFLPYEEPKAVPGEESEHPGGASGIGIEIDITVPTGVYVKEIMPHGSAFESGIEIGAQIVSADGTDITDMNYLEGRRYIVGDQWTSVTVGYVNPGSTEVLYETLVRHNIDISNVLHKMIPDTNIGYISVAGFDTAHDILDFTEAYNELLPEAGAESVIIDLRSNPGGIVDVVMYMFDAMTKEEGLLVCDLIGNGKAEQTTESYHSLGWTEEQLAEMQLSAIWEPDEIIVLVDNKTASAAEIMAGALQAHDFAEVVGTVTYGKAHAQYHLTLTSNDILIFTISRVELHEIGSYEGVGIVPDHTVEMVVRPATELGYETLYPNLAIFPGTKMKNRVTALQQRLRLLGYYRAEPTGVFDDYTVWALNRFQAWKGLRQTGFASVPALRALDEWYNLLNITYDTQLDYAIELCS